MNLQSFRNMCTVDKIPNEGTRRLGRTLQRTSKNFKASLRKVFWSGKSNILRESIFGGECRASVV
jgi:hypothetical protein